MRLTDRFYLGEPQMRGFDIRGLGPRVVRKPYIDTDADGVLDTVSTDRRQWTDDALGGKYYYLARAEMEIPLGSGAKELGLRPSIFIDAGAVWGVKRPDTENVAPPGTFLATKNSSGQPLFTQIDAAEIKDGVCTTTASSTTTSQTNTNATLPTCLNGNRNNTALGNYYSFMEDFLGDTWKPRVAIGIGVNWNSPFGPFRIDFSKVLLKRKGDDTKAFTFNVGTQF